MKYQEFIFSKAQPWEYPAKGVKRQILGYDDRLMMVRVDSELDSDGGGVHSHSHSQSTMVVSGVFDVTIGDKTSTLVADDAFFVPSGILHGVRCIKEGTLIDAFSPVREEFLKK